MPEEKEMKETKRWVMVEEAEWEELGRRVLEMKVEIEANNRELEKLKKELELIKHLINEQLSKKEHVEKVVNVRFFVGLSKTLKRVEKLVAKYQIEKKEFLTFLELLLRKAKKEKLRVRKPWEKVKEFFKLKEKGEETGL